jgi:hypothetical protein
MGKYADILAFANLCKSGRLAARLYVDVEGFVDTG